MIGWQYTTDPNKKDVSLCSKMRSKTKSGLVIEFLPHILLTLSISLLIMRLSNDKFTKRQIHILLLITLVVTLSSMFIPKFLQKTKIGSGLSLNLNSFVIFMILSLISCGNVYYGLIFFNYIILTELLLPRSIVGKSLKLVGSI